MNAGLFSKEALLCKSSFRCRFLCRTFSGGFEAKTVVFWRYNLCFICRQRRWHTQQCAHALTHTSTCSEPYWAELRLCPLCLVSSLWLLSLMCTRVLWHTLQDQLYKNLDETVIMILYEMHIEIGDVHIFYFVTFLNINNFLRDNFFLILSHRLKVLPLYGKRPVTGRLLSVRKRNG